MRTVSTALAALLLAGCTAKMERGMANVLDSWKGAHIGQAIKQWGYPHAEKKIAGHHLYIWNQDGKVSYPSTTSGMDTTPGGMTYIDSYASRGRSVDAWCRRVLEVDPDGLIISGEMEGNWCTSRALSKWRRKTP